MDETSTAPSGRYNYEGLDRLVHEKARLGILTSLLVHRDGLTFNQLKDLCALTDGNLSRHLDVLAEQGLIEIEKTFRNKRPQTTCSLTRAGRARFQQYIAELSRVVADAAAAAAGGRADPAAPPAGLSPA